MKRIMNPPTFILMAIITVLIVGISWLAVMDTPITPVSVTKTIPNERFFGE